VAAPFFKGRPIQFIRAAFIAVFLKSSTHVSNNSCFEFYLDMEFIGILSGADFLSKDAARLDTGRLHGKTKYPAWRTVLLPTSVPLSETNPMELFSKRRTGYRGRLSWYSFRSEQRDAVIISIHGCVYKTMDFDHIHMHDSMKRNIQVHNVNGLNLIEKSILYVKLVNFSMFTSDFLNELRRFSTSDGRFGRYGLLKLLK